MAGPASVWVGDGGDADSHAMAGAQPPFDLAVAEIGESMEKENDAAPTDVRRIQHGDVVGYRFVIRDAAGEVLAASTELVHYVHGGDGSLPRAVEKQMEGRKTGETFATELSERRPPGPRMLRRVTLPSERFPQLFALPEGSRVDALDPDGVPISLQIEERKGIEVKLDFDHPFSERASVFEISVLSIRTATSAEWDSGRPDGTAIANEKLTGDLVRLRDVLRQQFADEKGTDGLFDVLLGPELGNQRRVATLREEHQLLLEELDSIISRVSDPDTSFDHRPALARLVRGVAEHDAEGASLLIDSLNRDVGGEG